MQFGRFEKVIKLLTVIVCKKEFLKLVNAITECCSIHFYLGLVASIDRRLEGTDGIVDWANEEWMLAMQGRPN